MVIITLQDATEGLRNYTPNVHSLSADNAEKGKDKEKQREDAAHKSENKSLKGPLKSVGAPGEVSPVPPPLSVVLNYLKTSLDNAMTDIALGHAVRGWY